jgi:hypothetical protein
MVLFDAHAHLAAPEFAEDLPAVLTRAEAAGVVGIVTVGETLADAERILDLARRHPVIKPAAGLYPTVLDRDAASAVIALVWQSADRLVALGEVGLDHWAVKTEAEWRVQEAILEEFVALSDELDLPLNVHSRSAGRHAIAFLRSRNARRVLLHAFDGKAATAAAVSRFRRPWCDRRRSRSSCATFRWIVYSWRPTRPSWGPTRRSGTNRPTSPSPAGRWRISKGCPSKWSPRSPRTTPGASFLAPLRDGSTARRVRGARRTAAPAGRAISAACPMRRCEVCGRRGVEAWGGCETKNR